MNAPVLTLKEVADYLHVHPQTIRQLINRKDSPLPCFKIGTDYRFNQEAVLRWMMERQQRQGPPAAEEVEIWRARAKKTWETRRKNRAKK